MKKNSNRRLVNVKTRSETGFDHVMTHLDLNTPFGRKLLKERKPFFPGEEEELCKALDRVENMVEFVKGEKKQVAMMREVFMCMNDLTYTITRSSGSVLSVMELFELKGLLLQMKTLDRISEETKHPIPEEFQMEDITDLLDRLDPRGDRMNTFYIYDDFSEKLAELRREKHQIELSARKAQKARKAEIRRDYGIELTPKFDVILRRTSNMLDVIRTIPDMEQISEDYMSITF